MTDWHILTGEYPPQLGGVSDYTRTVARGLAEAGDEVHVYAPPCGEVTPIDVGVEVHRLPDHFGPRSLWTLKVALNDSSRPRRILVQYVPQAFGWHGMNLPFCLWLRSKGRESIWVMFHEVHFPLSRKQSPVHNVLGVITRLMALIAAHAAERIFISIPAWKDMLRPLAPKDTPISWLPIPSSIPLIDNPAGVARIRARYAPSGVDHIIGHFGTYGTYMRETLMTVLPQLLSGKLGRTALLLGQGSQSARAKLIRQFPELIDRVNATGVLSAANISLHLQACDLLVQPFVDGVSSRRTSLMSGLSHGLPIVTTKGFLTEPLWAESRGVALADAVDVDEIVRTAERLLEYATARESLCKRAIALYQERFDIKHTLAGLIETEA